MTSEFEIFRGALAEIFVNPIKERVKLVFNETVESYEQLDDGVNVHLKNSKEVKKYDVLVAADGLGSKIRAQMVSMHRVFVVCFRLVDSSDALR